MHRLTWKLALLVGAIAATAVLQAQQLDELGARQFAREDPGPGVRYAGVPRGFKVIEEDILVPEGFGARFTHNRRLWPTPNAIPYTLSPVAKTKKAQVRAAMEVWESVAGVRFVERTNEPDHIYIKQCNGNSSEVGYQGRKQTLCMYNWNSKFIFAHELGHALALHHEQSRPDRDTYVTVYKSQIQQGKGSNFNKYTTTKTKGDYDFESVMHYKPCAFSKCGSPCTRSCCTTSCRTITPTPDYEQYLSVMGQRSRLSALDKAGMKVLYP